MRPIRAHVQRGLATVRGDWTANPIRTMGQESALRRARSLLRLTLAAASVATSLVAVSVVAYLGPAGGYFFAFIVATLVLSFATFALLAGMRAPGLRPGVVRGYPIAAAVLGDDLKRYRRAAAPQVKVWSRCVIAVVVVAILAAGPLTFFPAGTPSFSHGRYVETSHGAIVRVLTRAEYEQLNMRVLRFTGTISALMLAGITTLLSGSVESEKRRPAH